MRHLITLLDLSSEDLVQILNIGSQVKQRLSQNIRPNWLPGTILAMLFEKPSLRTRVSFEAGMAQLGGTALYLGADVGWQQRESLSDFTRVLGEYVDFLVCRSKSHQLVVELASFDCVPIINGLTDRAHPCQALGDLMTMQEVLGPNLTGKTLTFVGDGNNVAQTLALACAMQGMRFRLLGPADYHIQTPWIDEILLHFPKADIQQATDKSAMLHGADFVYTDVWTSMGQESESSVRRQAFAPYQLNAQLMSMTKSTCKVLHCLPARRGEEITDQVIDGPNSLIVQQAGNRMHAQKGLLLWMSIQNGRMQTKQLIQEGISV
jgi:ornithine carbamoyltransferase